MRPGLAWWCGIIPHLELPTQYCIEMFVVAIFPGCSWENLHRLDADPSELFLKRCSDEHWAVVRTNDLWHAFLHQQ